MDSGAEAVRDGNRRAWEAERYEAWVAAMGTPRDEARRIVADPQHVLRRVGSHLGELAGARICSVQGSHGRVAVALALLGAEPTVIDFSEENRRYAQELAAAAGVSLDYRVCDVMAAGGLGLAPFDAVLMELGILHYHQDLVGFFGVMATLAAPGARLVLNEFHPVQRKLFQEFGLEARDYFSPDLVVADVPDPTGQGRRLGTCAYRFWTLGEVVGAVLAAGFRITGLEEHPDWSDPRIPGTYTLTAER
jgi:2-polyprenyl-3-methyl-5-hydroxy-6-metoxy-1,4-benzoquinol methylase